MTRFPACFDIPHIPFNEDKPLPLKGGYYGSDLFQVTPPTGQEVVQTNYLLI
jgi:hypothetical protein